jgi:integrase
MIDVRDVGRHLGRERRENGWVERIGKRVKKWRGYYHVYASTAEGQEKRLRRKVTLGVCTEMSKGEAVDKLRDHIRRTRGQEGAASSAAFVSTLCDDYFNLRKGDWSETNQGTVRSVLDNLIKPIIGNRPVASVTPEELKFLVNGLPDRRWLTPQGNVRCGCSDSYAKKCITYLRAIFDLALSRDLVRRNPARDPIIRLMLPKQVRKPAKGHLAVEDIPHLLAQLNADDYLVIYIALVCALRPGEVYVLRRNDVGEGWLRIDESLDRQRRSQAPKTNSSNASVVLPPRLQRELGDWLRSHPGAPSDLLFPNRVGRPKNRQNELDRVLKPAAKRAGLGKVTFQMLRRTFSTLVQKIGGLKDIQAQMRHARPDTTASIYMQTLPAQQTQTISNFEEMILGKKRAAAR